jgi:predicted ATPase
LWRGPPYGEFADEEWAYVEVQRLEALRTRVVEGRIECRLLLGRHAEVIGELEGLTTMHPLHERFWLQLMLAHYRCNRQADALRTYRMAREVLAEEVGVAPSPSLQALEQRILAQDADLMVRTSATRPRPVDVGRLPIPRSRTIGRESAITRIEESIRSCRLTTIVGVGGVGKTRVAMEAARLIQRDIGRQVWWVELAPVGDRDDVLTAIAAGLGLQPNPADDLISSIVAATQDEPLLLALDNCEHVIDHLCEVVDAILSQCRDATILATSREALSLDGEVVIPLAPLSLDPVGAGERCPAVDLFVQRARATGFEAEFDEVAIEEICRRLDGIPLAIEMAASLARSVTVEEMLENLARRFDLLVGGRRATDRHRTLRAALQWSYDLLDESQQDLLCSIGVFAGSFSVDDVRRVLGLDYAPAAAGLRQLVDKSLLTSSHSRGRTRFQLLETVRGFASEQLEATGRAPERRRRHVAAYSELAVQLGRMSRGSSDAEAVELVGASIDDFREAFRWAERTGDHESALTIVTELFDVAMWAGPIEIIRWADDALTIPGAALTARGATALAITGESLLRSGDFRAADRVAMEAMQRTPAPHRPTVPHSVRCGVALFGPDGDLATRANEMRVVAEASGATFDAVLAGVNSVAASCLPVRWQEVAVARGAAASADALLEAATTLGNAALLSLAHYCRGATRDDYGVEGALEFRRAAEVAAKGGYVVSELRARREAAYAEGVAADDPSSQSRELLELAARLRGPESTADLYVLVYQLVRLAQLGENWRLTILLWSVAVRLLGPPPAGFADPVRPARDALGAQQFDAARQEAELLNLPGALAIALRAVPMSPSPTTGCP